LIGHKNLFKDRKMKELIKVTENENGEGVVSARELHAFLEVGTHFKDWVVRRIQEYGFQEDRDFSSFLSESPGGRPSKEYAITLDMAKELSMVERTEKGRQARRYFIACEKKLREVSANKNIGSGKVLEALNIFNAGMQACTSLDMWKSMASERANHLAMEHTGVDILGGLGISDGDDGQRDPRRMLY